MHYLYRITCLINNKIYIGQTINPHARWWKHKNDAENNPIQVITRAINKYGKDNFTFEVIATCKTEDDCNITEQQLITQYDSLVPNGYNVDSGGKRQTCSEETKQKISQALKGMKRTEESRVKQSLTTKGKTKKKLTKPRLMSDEQKKKMSEIGKKRQYSEATRLKMSDSAKRRWGIQNANYSDLNER